MLKNLDNDWKKIDDSLERVKNRPNDMQQLMIACYKNGMPMIDIARVFQLTDKSVRAAIRKYLNVKTKPDNEYFIDRAKKLGMRNVDIDKWFRASVR